MCSPVIRFAPVLLVLVSLTAAGCERSDDMPTSPSASAAQASITAEPRSATPEFLSSRDCAGTPPFGVRVFISLRGRDVVLSGLRFQFIDLVGTRTLPEVIRLPSPSSAATSLPSASPVTLPGIAALPPLPVSSPIPFFARFGCGVVPDGTLVITGNLDGRTETIEIAVKR